MDVAGKIALLKPLGNGADVIVNISPFEIGRCRNANLIIPSVNISRNHLQLKLIEDKTWIVEDLSSSGTYVNYELVGKGNSVILKNNDIIMLGPKDCSFIWQFKTDCEKQLAGGGEFDNINSQSQTVVEICNQKDSLQRIITHQKMRMEKEKLHEEYLTQVKALEEKFLEEKKELEEKIKEQNEKLEYERLRADEISLIQGQKLQDKLKKEEEEKRLLMEKLREMEKAKELLSQKLKESDELHSVEKARLEEKMKQELMKKEENIKALFREQIDSLQKNQTNSDKFSNEEEKNVKNQDLLLDLDGMKNNLVERESRQQLLGKEQTHAASLQDEALKVKSNVLENIADLMETELQCSVCSELFVTAITLNCTHTFCKYCIDTWKKKKKNCPICRKKITSENRSIVMDNYIDKMVENLSEEFKNRRMAVIADRNNGVPHKKVKTSTSTSVTPGNMQSTMSASLRTSEANITVRQNSRLIARMSHNSR